MLHYKKLCVALCAIALVACREKTFNEQKYADCPNYVFITEEDLPPVQKLELEKIDLPEDICMASNYYVYNDSILLVLRKRHPNPYYVSVLRMGTWEVLGQYIKRGSGPNEIINANLAYLCDNICMIEDYTTGSLISFHVDSALILGDRYTPKTIRIKDHMYLYGNELTDSTFVSANPYFFDDDPRFASGDSVEMLFLFDKNGKPLTSLKSGDKYVANETGGLFPTSRKAQRFMHTCINTPRLFISDFNLNILKVIVGPDPSNAQYTISAFGDKSVSQVGDKYNVFWDNSCVDGTTAMIVNFRKVQGSSEFVSKSTAEIFRMDFDGNISARYSIAPLPILALSFCENSNTLYLTSWDEDEENTLYRAKLN